MGLLLDECVPKRLGRLLAPHDVQTVQQAGWSGIKNGALLARAAESFDVFVAADPRSVRRRHPRLPCF